LAILLGVGLTLNPKELPSALINKPAPHFSLDLLNGSGSTFSPSDLKGERWILNVWASWCPSCKYEHATKWLAQRGIPYTKIPSDINGDVGIEWGVYGAPETFVIDEQGNIIYRHAGPIDPQILESEIAPFFPQLQTLFANAKG